MPPLSPPLFRGKVATTPRLFLLGSGVMFFADLLVAIFCESELMSRYFPHWLVMLGVLLLASRRWVAVLLLLVASGMFLACGAEQGQGGVLEGLVSLLPLWVGTMVAFPRRRRHYKGE